ncbi:MAG: DUF1552 domain-containing protein [Myxococcaceae bacterium]
MRRFNRRDLLKAVGALPLLPSLSAFGEAMAYPRRFIVFYHPNGTLPTAWWPTNVTSETAFTLNQIHDPLQSFKNDLLIFKGIDLKSNQQGPGEPHQNGMGGLLTGRSLMEGQFVGGDGSLAGWGSGISVDQRIAQVVGAGTKERSVQLGVRVHASEVRTRLSYSGAGQPLPPQNDPQEVFNLLFADFKIATPELEKLRKRRGSVLDAVRGQFAALTPRLTGADRQKLEAHLTLVRDLESRLSAMGNQGNGACVVLDRPAVVEPDNGTTMPDITRLQIDLLVGAMACDLTRVGSLMLCGAIDAISYPWLNSSLDGHTLSHLGDTDPQKPEIVARDRWTATQVAYLLGKLKAIPEGTGTMLDNTVVLWSSEIAVGNTHSQQDMPFVLAGGKAGGLRGGRYLQLDRRSHNDLLVSVLQAMGLPDTTFGDPAFCSGPLPGLT